VLYVSYLHFIVFELASKCHIGCFEISYTQTPRLERDELAKMSY